MAIIVHVMGPTCAGKSTLIQTLVSIDPERIAAVEVGKLLRAKYVADHFKGQAAPEHTQAEAWSMYVVGVAKHLAHDKELILVDGQPREHSQVMGVLKGLWPSHDVRYLLVHARHEVRERRARGTRTGDSLDLAIRRLDNDYKNCYIVMAELLKANKKIEVLDTSDLTDVTHDARALLDEWTGGASWTVK